jgi:hypothetical protein
VSADAANSVLEQVQIGQNFLSSADRDELTAISKQTEQSRIRAAHNTNARQLIRQQKLAELKEKTERQKILNTIVNTFKT